METLVSLSIMKLHIGQGTPVTIDYMGHAATKPDKVNISIIKDFRDQ